MTRRRAEADVITALGIGGAAGFGGVLALFLFWWLGTTVWGAPSDSAHGIAAAAAVPPAVIALLIFGVPALLAGGAAFWAVRARAEPEPEQHPALIDVQLQQAIERIDSASTRLQQQDAMQQTGPIGGWGRGGVIEPSNDSRDTSTLADDLLNPVERR